MHITCPHLPNTLCPKTPKPQKLLPIQPNYSHDAWNNQPNTANEHNIKKQLLPFHRIMTSTITALKNKWSSTHWKGLSTALTKLRLNNMNNKYGHCIGKWDWSTWTTTYGECYKTVYSQHQCLYLEYHMPICCVGLGSERFCVAEYDSYFPVSTIAWLFNFPRKSW